MSIAGTFLAAALLGTDVNEWSAPVTKRTPIGKNRSLVKAARKAGRVTKRKR